MIQCKSIVEDRSRQTSAGFEPATIVVTACPAVGKEAAWEQALGELIRASLAYSGHLGTTVLKPASPNARTYQVITKWDSEHNMRRWAESDERRQRVEQLSLLEAKPASIQHVSGMETWFDLPHRGEPQHGGSQFGEPQAITAPPKHKMAVIVWVAVFVGVLPLIDFVKLVTSGWPPLAAKAAGVTASVVLMTWIALPFLTWLFRFWLYPELANRGAQMQMETADA